MLKKRLRPWTGLKLFENQPYFLILLRWASFRQHKALVTRSRLISVYRHNIILICNLQWLALHWRQYPKRCTSKCYPKIRVISSAVIFENSKIGTAFDIYTFHYISFIAFTQKILHKNSPKHIIARVKLDFQSCSSWVWISHINVAGQNIVGDKVERDAESMSRAFEIAMLHEWPWRIPNSSL